MNLYIHVSIKHHYSCYSFFRETICLLHLPTVYRIKCLGEVYKQLFCLEIFCMNSFDDSVDCQNLWCGSISLKSILIFPKNFLNSRFDNVEKQSIINFSSYRSKYYATVVLDDSEATFLREGEDEKPLYIYIYIYVHTYIHTYIYIYIYIYDKFISNVLFWICTQEWWMIVMDERERERERESQDIRCNIRKKYQAERLDYWKLV